MVNTESFLHQSVVCEGDALLPHPAVATLVDELSHRLQVGVSEEIQIHSMKTHQNTITFSHLK